MTGRKGQSPDEIANLLRELSENELDGGTRRQNGMSTTMASLTANEQQEIYPKVDCVHGINGSRSYITNHSTTYSVCYASFGVHSYYSTLFAAESVRLPFLRLPLTGNHRRLRRHNGAMSGIHGQRNGMKLFLLTNPASACNIAIEANPQVYVETPLHPEKLTVWCALWAGGIIGPYFFKNDEGHNVTVNGDWYRAMITNFFIPELNNHDVQELWFQQDGATCHTACAAIDLLKDTFGDRLISRFGPVNWPSISCDLTPLDYFLWGYVKSLVYAVKPQTLDHLEDNIRRVIADIRPQMLEKVIENWTSRLDYIRASRGSPMPEIIFKM
ncbi:uncharacterized protein TNCV_2035481 [Trichonephila clavipes]|nr:uncharacterized protein TNCV_2035481 [Trichonephila clavipes]